MIDALEPGTLIEYWNSETWDSKFMEHIPQNKPGLFIERFDGYTDWKPIYAMFVGKTTSSKFYDDMIVLSHKISRIYG